MSVTYYPINEGAARRAKEANNFSDYVPGGATAAYHQFVDVGIKIAESQKKRVSLEYLERIDSLLDLYAPKLAENINDSFAIDARFPSILVAGPAVSLCQKEKQNCACEKKCGRVAGYPKPAE